MAKNFSRRAFMTTTSIMALATGLLSACSGSSNSASSAESSSASNEKNNGAGAASKGLTIGSLATEDILPLWVAQDAGLFQEAGLDANIVTFQSATELIAGMASAEVDLAMTDIMVTASMFANGIDVQMQWVTLGTQADQGRFGIMVGPSSNIKSLKELANVPIGVGSNTILEYVMDKLMEAAGVPDDAIVVEELQKLPVRYQAMLSGDVAAAALPGTLLALGEAHGCTLVADDTKGENLSQSVMIVRANLLSEETYVKRIAQLEDIWDEAVARINKQPESYRALLVSNANLSEDIADTYPISTYPSVQLPTAAMVEPVLSWMQKKAYLTKSLSYDEKTGSFSEK